ncbi:hypothetical protein [Alcanivorax jadensis]|uniref:hypothetical protein n=1 Tax=Alcanivorax jadensis TaxID=64988 RepID=UPI002352C504|nr:hypothetical protein [Alcanivorax jadensis]|tara:strand:- start:509 stop:754 length:246 start_codon:yes stop_codon:yes gene_type:complete
MSDKFPTSVNDTDCQCLVTHYKPGIAPKRTGHPDTWDDGEDSEFKFELLDENGDRAEWLEDDLTNDDCARLEQEYLEFERG